MGASDRHRARHLRQLATLLRMGVPLVQALAWLERGPFTVRERLQWSQVRQGVEQGLPLSRALQLHAQLTTVEAQWLVAGELSGQLDDTLERLGRSQDARDAWRRRLRQAAAYPLMVLAVAVGVSAWVLVAVVPTFEGLFAGMNSALPPLTQRVLDLSQTLRAQPALFLACLASVALAGGLLLRHPRGRWGLQQLALRLPGVRQWIGLHQVGLWSRSLGALLQSGMGIDTALTATAGLLSHPQYRWVCGEMAIQMRQGLTLSACLQRQATLFPPLAIELCAVGEQSGTLPLVLENLVQALEASLDEQVQQCTRWIEPALLLWVGVVVSVLVLALYLPLFEMGHAL